MLRLVKEHLRAIVEYTNRNGTATIQAYAPELESIIVNYLNESIKGLGSDNTQLFLETVNKSQAEAESIHIANEHWTHLEIGPQTTSIYDKVSGTNSSSKVEVSTNSLKELVLAWADIYDSFRSAQTNNETWHGISLHKNNPTEADILYWNPKTNEVGYFKDTPEGREQEKKYRKSAGQQ